MQGGIEGLRTFGCLLTLLSGRGLQAASMPGWIVVNDLAWGLENGDAASTPRPGPLAIGGSVRIRPGKSGDGIRDSLAAGEGQGENSPKDLRFETQNRRQSNPRWLASRCEAMRSQRERIYPGRFMGRENAQSTQASSDQVRPGGLTTRSFRSSPPSPRGEGGRSHAPELPGFSGVIPPPSALKFAGN